MNAHTHVRTLTADEPSVFEIEPGMLERNLQAAIDDIVERYGDEARYLVTDAWVNAISRKRARK